MTIFLIGDKPYDSKPIKDYEDYLIIENGQIFSKKSNKLLNPVIQDGYAKITLLNNKGSKQFRVNRLVGIAFLKNDDPDKKVYVHHMNQNRLDNSVTNLDWVTPQENAARRINTIYVETDKGFVCLADCLREELGIMYSKVSYNYAYRLISNMQIIPIEAVRLTKAFYLPKPANDAFYNDSTTSVV